MEEKVKQVDSSGISGHTNFLAKFNGRPAPGIASPNFKDFGDFFPETVLIVGNGAIEGCDQFLKKAIKRHLGIDHTKNSFPNPEKRIAMTKLPVEKYLSIMAFYAKHTFSEVNRIIGNKENLAELSGPLTRFRELISLKEYIAEEIQFGEKNGEIKLREVPKAIQEALGEGKLATLTTNWDDRLWVDERFSNVMYVHGRAEFWQSILFPVEFSFEMGFPDELIKLVFAGTDEKLKAILESTNDSLKWATSINHDRAIDWLQRAKRVIYWGSALNTYDAELLGLINIADATSPKTKEKVISINPDGQAAATAAALLGKLDYEGHLP